MCSKLKGNENSIKFIIVGGKILWVEQTGSHWRMMGLKGRNEVCEHSDTDISAPVVLCEKQNAGVILHMWSTCGASSSALNPSTCQPATSPVFLIPGERCPSQRGRRCRQKSSLWLWIIFQQLVPLSLTNEGRLFLGHGRRLPCWHYPTVNLPSPWIN